MNPPDWRIVEDDDGTHHAVGEPVSMTVLPDGDARLFKRNAMKNVGTPHMERKRWLVAELDGVRVYCNGQSVVVTKQDLYP